MIPDLIEGIKNTFSENPVAQIIGFIAFGISVYNFLFCKDRKFIIVTAIASGVWGLHYLSLGLLAAMIVNFFDVFKNLIALKYERNIKWVLGFTLIYLIIGVFSYTGELVSTIPTLTAIIGTYLVFYVRGIWLNLGFLVIIGLWMIYNYLGGSIGGISTDIFLTGFCLIGVGRQILENKKKENDAK